MANPRQRFNCPATELVGAALRGSTRCTARPGKGAHRKIKPSGMAWQFASVHKHSLLLPRTYSRLLRSRYACTFVHVATSCKYEHPIPPSCSSRRRRGRARALNAPIRIVHHFPLCYFLLSRVYATRRPGLSLLSYPTMPRFFPFLFFFPCSHPCLSLRPRRIRYAPSHRDVSYPFPDYFSLSPRPFVESPKKLGGFSFSEIVGFREFDRTRISRNV